MPWGSVAAILRWMDWVVSLTPEAAADPMAALSAPPERASIVELRIDRFPGIDVRAAVARCPLPLLATVRSHIEGGEGPDDPEARAALIGAAREAGAALLDLEFERDVGLIRRLGLAPEQVVLSWHHPSATPDELPQVAARMLETPSRWIKVVPTAVSVANLVSVLGLHHRFNTARRRSRRLLSFAMGTPGLASRYLAPLLGPPISFAAWNEAAPAAPGQLTIETTEAVIGHLAGPPQRLYGVVGADVSRSLSPVLHSAGYRSLGLPYLLLPISVPDGDELAGLVGRRGSSPFDRIGLETWGWAVTTPYKAEAAAAADRMAPRAARAGAANTLILGEHQVIAENTDADGIVGALITAGIDPQGLKALVQGTGGAARGAAVGLDLAGADVVLRGRSVEHTRDTAGRLELSWCGPYDAAPDGAILVNATPVGHAVGETGPFSEDEVRHSAAVVDMVYSDHTTAIVARARELGVPAADGLEVLLHQGIAQFAAFTQRVPPRDAMREALNR